jgi:hypothetical protein
MGGEQTPPQSLEYWLPTALKMYEEELFLPNGIHFAHDSRARFERTEGKAYRGRMAVPVVKADEELGKVHILVFAYGDGTGAESPAYSLKRLSVPQHLLGPEFLRRQPQKLVPREKDSRVEAFFPFFSFQDSVAIYNAVSLEELTVDDPENPKEIVTFGHLGFKPENFIRALENGGDYPMKTFITTGHVGLPGRPLLQFGNPHSIVYSARTKTEPLQVVGFLAVEDEKNPLHDILYEHGDLFDPPDTHEE